MRVTIPEPRVRRMHGGGARSPGALSGSSLLQLRRVIALQRQRPLPAEALATVAHGVAADAWARGLRAEQMLVALKAAWLHEEETRRLPSPVARELLDHLVTRAIRAYYSADGGSGRGPR